MTLRDDFSLRNLSPAGLRELRTLLTVVTASGLTNGVALYLINRAGQAPTSAGLTTLILFLLAVSAYIVTARWTSHRINGLIEAELHRMKVRFFARIERSELRRIEALGAAEILDRLSQNMATISTTASGIARVVQALFVVVFALFYMYLLSPAAFVVAAVLQTIALLLFRAGVLRTGEILRDNDAAGLRFLERLMGLVRGAKEIKLNHARGQAVVADFTESAAELRDTTTRFTQVTDGSLVFFDAQRYVVLAVLVFVLPEYVAFSDATLGMVVSATLFLWGNVEGGINRYPSWIRAAQAIRALAALERKLDGSLPEAPCTVSEWPAPAGPLELRGVEYTYTTTSGGPAFRIGPMDLTFAPGEVVFLVGGNGSGKSTLLKVLTGLYPPTHGVMRLGGVTVHASNAAAYREQISLILTDFHLFSRTYGLDVDPARVTALLREMRLTDKTTYKRGRFTRRDLSTGQRKRLAMIVALLEDRPILVLDEWPAEQDPEFRRYFYETLIPRWRADGKIVIAVSHDDRYFGCADRVLDLEYGRVRAIRHNPRPQHR